MVRQGGLIIILHSLYDGKVADPAMRSPEIVAMRQLLKTISVDEQVLCSLVGNNDGMTVCMKL